MIAGNFVSCYRCAGEGSDLSCSRFFGVGGGQWDDWGLEGLEVLVSEPTIGCRPSRARARNWKREFYIL